MAVAGLNSIEPDYASPRWRIASLNVNGRGRGAAADQIGGFLGDHDYDRVDVAADQVRHYRGIDDAQPVDTQDLEFGIDDRSGIVRPRHLAGAEGVMNGDCGRPDMGVDLRVGPAIRAGRDFSGRERRQGRLSTDLAHETHAGAQRGPVLLDREEILADADRDPWIG